MNPASKTALRVGALSLIAGAALACGGGEVNTTARLPSPRGSSSASASASSAAAAGDPAPAPGEPALDVKSLPRWTEDPRLAQAKLEHDKGHALEAGRAVHAARAALGSAATAADRARFAYLEGLLLARGGAPQPALAAFDEASAEDSPIADHARVRAATLAAAMGRHKDAVDRLNKVATARIPRDRLEARFAESFARAAPIGEVLPMVTNLFLDGSRQSGWASGALRVAKALAKRTDPGAAALALRLADTIRYDGPRGRFAGDAEKIGSELAGRLPAREQAARTTPAPIELLARAERLARSDQEKKALTLLDRFKKSRAAKDLDGEGRCTLGLARAEALDGVKRRREAYDEGVGAQTACAGGARELEAWLTTGRIAARAGLHVEAAKTLAEVERRFPDSPDADDALFESAREALASGASEAFFERAGGVVARYRKGDRARDALFALALEHGARGDFDAVLANSAQLAAIEREAKLAPERGYLRAGRFSFVRGRALLAKGRADEAAAAFAETVTSAPLGYYAALALAQLERLQPGEAVRLLARELAKPAAVALPEIPARRAEEPNLAAALTLGALGDREGLEDALAGLGAAERASGSSEPPLSRAQIALLGARLLAQAGELQAAHAMLRIERDREPRAGEDGLLPLVADLPRGTSREVWELAFPRPFQAEVAAAALESGVSEDLIYAVMREESSFLPKARSLSDARGLLQVIPPTAAKMARGLGLRYRDETLYDPVANTRIGARYLAGLLRGFGPHTTLAIAGYNAGPGAPAQWVEDRPAEDMDLWIEHIPYLETRNYVKRVWSSAFVYEVLRTGAAGSIAALPAKAPAERPKAFSK